MDNNNIEFWKNFKNVGQKNMDNINITMPSFNQIKKTQKQIKAYTGAAFITRGVARDVLLGEAHSHNITHYSRKTTKYQDILSGFKGRSESYS